MIIILKSKVSFYSFKSACCLAVENVFLKQRNTTHEWYLKRKGGKIPRRWQARPVFAVVEVQDTITSTYGAKTKWQKVVKKINHLQTKIGDTILRTVNQ